MELTPGTSIGPYKILSVLGAGGMGEVYRVEDTRLGRQVAIKILPDVFARDADRRGRFDREARLLGSLSHPNIATVHGLQEIGSRTLLEMEFVPGENLAERLRRGPMPLAEALQVFKQVALALEAAHDRGIIHRDLKPANVKVTPEGRVKVLDFGLAKAVEPDSGSGSDRSQSPTYITNSDAGTIIGTAAYMSPEQARGKFLDRRTDVWSFGCMLYEALAGRPPFDAESVPDVIAAILKEDANWEALPPIPLAVDRLLRRCLRKDPQARLRDIADARIEIDEALGETQPALVQPRPVARERSHTQAWIVVGVLGAFALGAFTTWLPRLRPTVPASPVTRFVVSLLPEQQLERGVAAPLALSPDGRTLVYVAVQPSGRTQLFLRSMDRVDATPLPGTVGGSAPFFSPDGRWVGFYADGALQKVSIGGGPALKICDAPPLWSATWTSTDSIVFATTVRPDGLWQVAAGGGPPAPLTKPDAQRGDVQHAFPQMLADGTRILLSIVGEREWRLGLLSLKTRDLQQLDQTGSIGVGAQFVPTGHVIHAQAGGLVAVPFDIARGAVVDSPIPMLERVDTARAGSANFTTSATGSLAYVPGRTSLPHRTLVRVDRDGRAIPLLDARAAYSYPRFSRDGTQLAVVIDDEAGSDIWIRDLVRGTRTRLTRGGSNGFPEWSPDGTRVAFASDSAGPSSSLFSVVRDGSQEAQPFIDTDSPERSAWDRGTIGLLPGSVPVLTGANPYFPMSWAASGDVLAFADRKPSAERDIWVLTADRTPSPFLLTPFDEHSAAFSPGGRWLAYVSDESGRPEVYVQPYPGPGGKWLISNEGGTDPAWSPDGREIFYRHDDLILAVPVGATTELRPGRPQALFEARYETLDAGRNYDVSPDGRYFVFVRSEDAAPPAQLHMVLHWFENLKARAPRP